MTAGGILLPESVQSKINEGTIIAVGPGGRTRDGATVPIVRSLDTHASRIPLTLFVYAECECRGCCAPARVRWHLCEVRRRHRVLHFQGRRHLGQVRLNASYVALNPLKR